MAHRFVKYAFPRQGYHDRSRTPSRSRSISSRYATSRRTDSPDAMVRPSSSFTVDAASHRAERDHRSRTPSRARWSRYTSSRRTAPPLNPKVKPSSSLWPSDQAPSTNTALESSSSSSSPEAGATPIYNWYIENGNSIPFMGDTEVHLD